MGVKLHWIKKAQIQTDCLFRLQINRMPAKKTFKNHQEYFAFIFFANGFLRNFSCCFLLHKSLKEHVFLQDEGNFSVVLEAFFKLANP